MEKEIACAIYYPIPLHQQKAFADTQQPKLPVAEDVARRCLSFPIFPEMTEDMVETVCQAILSA